MRGFRERVVLALVLIDILLQVVDGAMTFVFLRPGWADRLNQGVRLLDKLIELAPVVELGDYRPTDAACAVFAHLSDKLEAQVTRFNQLVESDLAALNRLIAEAQLGAILPRSDGVKG